jgi:DNA polymerase
MQIAAATGYLYTHGKYPDHVKDTLDFRRLITPRPGRKLISADLAQIEPRVLAWLVKDHALLKQVGQGMSVYEAHARNSMGWDGEFGTMKKTDLQKYQLAKARVLSLGYGAGWKKFITMALNYTGEDITANDPETEIKVDPLTMEEYEADGYGKRSREIVNDFRNTNPKITQFWRTLDDQLRASIGSDLVITLPSGRKMRYNKVRSQCTVRPDKDGKPEKKMVITAEVMGKRREFYGGKIAENVTQAVARDVFGVGLVRIEEHGGYDNLFSAHDEAVTETDDGSKEELQELLGQTPEWLPGCPIEAEAAELDHYKK